MKHLAVREVLPFQDAEEPRLRLGDGKHGPIGGGTQQYERIITFHGKSKQPAGDLAAARAQTEIGRAHV